MREGNLLTEWARLLVGSLAAAGVRDVVVSPGSRSTPFVCAVHAEPRLRCWDVIDERAAGFFALGQARVSGRPSLLLCTSGTAGAHYLPAVIEAEAAHLPLLVLTADRPFELQDCGAAQTIDQVKLFAGHARRFIELGMPDGSGLALRALRRTAAQAVLTATWPTPGAVHLNARARKPLEPAVVHTEEEAALRAQVDALLQGPPVRCYPPHAVADANGIAAAAALCRRFERGLIVCGPAPLAHAELREDIAALAQATGFPLLCDAASQLRFGLPEGAPRCDGYDALLRCSGGLAAEDLELIVQIGAPSIASGVEQLLLARPALPRIVLSAHTFYDPEGTAQELLLGEVTRTVRALRTALTGTPQDCASAAVTAAADEPPATARTRRGQARSFAHRVQELDALAWQVLQGQLAAAGENFSEAAAVQATLAELPPDSVLMLGNSLPIREVDALCRACPQPLAVLSQRGTSGIEGMFAGAAGAATQLGRPLTLLLGDVSALHDLTSLGLLQRARGPVVAVVLQNRGGRIFEQLPLARTPEARADPALLSRFTTPHDLHLEPAARLYGLTYTAARDEAALRAALRRAFSPASSAAPAPPALIEAIVPASSAAALQQAYYAALTAALTAYRERTA